MQIVLLSHKEEWSKFMLERGVRSSVQGLKKYLASLLFKPVIGEMLFLYLMVSESAVSGALIQGGGI